MESYRGEITTRLDSVNEILYLVTRCYSVRQYQWKRFIHQNQMPLTFQTECSARAFLASKPQVHSVEKEIVTSFVFTSCSFRVYHIDSSPSGANDSAPDFAKAFTVSDINVSVWISLYSVLWNIMHFTYSITLQLLKLLHNTKIF